MIGVLVAERNVERIVMLNPSGLRAFYLPGVSDDIGLLASSPKDTLLVIVFIGSTVDGLGSDHQ